MIDCGSEAFQRSVRVEGVDKLAVEISGVAEIDRFDLFHTLVELIQFPLRRSRIEPRHAGACGLGRSLRNDDLETLKQPPSAAVFTAISKPQNAKRENSVDCGLQLFRIDGDYAPCRCSSRQHVARVGRTRAVLKVGGGAKALGRLIGKTAHQHAIQNAEILRARGLARRGRASIAIRDQLKHLGTCLTETPRFQGRSESLRTCGPRIVRTKLRSSDHRCSRQRPCSEDRE